MITQIRSEVELIKDSIEIYGCYIVVLEADGYLPSYAFTIGLYEKYGHPEIVTFGLGANTLTTMLNHATLLIEDGMKFNTEEQYSSFLNKIDIEFGDVKKEYYEPYFGTARRYYGNDDFPMLQLIWPDIRGNYPEDEEFDEDLKFVQPLLDRNTDFMFYEDRGLGAFISKNVWQGKPILYVYHDCDGDWEFHSQAETHVDDAKLVTLEQVVTLDSTLNQLFDLSLGWKATRKSLADEWIYEQFEDIED